MRKTFELLKEDFKTSSVQTPQYLEFHKTFKKEFKKLLKNLGVEKIKIDKPNHFDVDGFFKAKNQWWYFSISDLRWNKGSMFLRTAKNLEDYTGGCISYILLNDYKQFEKNLKNIIGGELK